MDASECPAASFSSRDPERNLTQLESSNVVKKKAEKKRTAETGKNHPFGCFQKYPNPKMDGLEWKNPIKMDDLGGKPTISGNTYICVQEKITHRF